MADQNSSFSFLYAGDLVTQRTRTPWGRMYMGPPEFLALLSARVENLFVKDDAGLSRRLVELNDRRAADGRFAVNVFYCFDPIWRKAVVALALRTATVLMDLRAFSGERKGCVSELRLLIDHFPLSQIVFLTDFTTNRHDLTRALPSAWRERRPNSPNPPGPAIASVLSVSSSGPADVRSLLERLCSAATVRPAA